MRVLGEEEDDAGDGGKGDGAQGAWMAVEATCLRWWAVMRMAAFRSRARRVSFLEDLADGDVVVAGESAEVGVDGIDDDESAAGEFFEGVFELVEVSGEGQEGRRLGSGGAGVLVRMEMRARSAPAASRRGRMVSSTSSSAERRRTWPGFWRPGSGDAEAAGDAGGEVEGDEGFFRSRGRRRGG